jgi:hypothetical protein
MALVSAGHLNANQRAVHAAWPATAAAHQGSPWLTLSTMTASSRPGDFLNATGQKHQMHVRSSFHVTVTLV